MATRLYLPSSGTPPLTSLAVDSNWELSTGLVRLPCSITKSNTALTDSVRTWASATTQQWVWWQFQSATLAEGYSWTTSDTVSLVIRGLEANLACDSHVVYSVRVVSADGSTVRGTVGLYHATSTEFTTSALTRIHNARTTGATNFTSYAGDRIIIELGLHGVTPSTAYTNTLRIGDPTATSDFALTAGLTTDLCPWVQLSRDVIFGNARIAASIGGGFSLTDDFNSYSAGELAGQGNWTTSIGSILVVADGDARTIIANTFDNDGGVYYNQSLDNDQYAEITITSVGAAYSDSFIGVAVRMSVNNMYFLSAGYGGVSFGKIVSGSGDSFRYSPTPISVNDVLKIQANGTTITAYINDELFYETTDSDLSSGYAGVTCYGSSPFEITHADNWEGGNLASSMSVTVSGTLSEAAPTEHITGQTNGVAGVTGTLLAKGLLGGVIDGTSTTSGTLQATGQIYTSSSGVALVAGTLNGRGLLQGAISTNGTVSGLLSGLGRLAVSINAIASVVGRLSSSGVFDGHIEGVASVSGSLSATVNISASINAAANVTGALKGSIIATSSGVSTATGRILATADLVITSSGVSLVSGTLKADGRLTTHITSTTSLTGILRAKGRLVTLINTQAVVSADLNGRGRLTGISQGVATCSLIPVLVTQAGIINGVALVSGTLRAKGRLSASINLYPIVSAHINGWFRLSTVITCYTNVLGLLLGKSHLSGTIAGVNSVSGLLLAKANLVGVITNINTSSAILRGNGSLIAQVNIVAILNATLLGEGRLTGLSEGIPLVWGAMREYIPPSALMGNILTYSEVSGSLWDAANVYRTFRGSVSMLGVKAQVINEDTGVKATLDTGIT